MTTAVLDRPAVAPSVRAAPGGSAAPADRAGRPAPADHATRRTPGGPGTPTTRAATLADAIAGAWETLLAHDDAQCLVCGGPMAPRYGASTAEPLGGRCTDCGSTLA
jgi:hypothetical protein